MTVGELIAQLLEMPQDYLVEVDEEVYTVPTPENDKILMTLIHNDAGRQRLEHSVEPTFTIRFSEHGQS